MGESAPYFGSWTWWPDERSNRAWFVCLFMGALTVVGSWFYTPLGEGPGVSGWVAELATNRDAGGWWTWGSSGGGMVATALPDLRPFTDSRWLFWLIALPTSVLLLTIITIISRRLRGEKPSAGTVVGAGIALAGVLAVVVWCAGATGEFSLRGLFPLVLVALGVVVLAVLERSGALVLASIAALALAIAANMINFADTALYVGELSFGVQFNVVAVGAALLIVGAVLLYRRIRSARPAVRALA